MIDTKISSPAISNFYRAIAADIRGTIPPEFDPLEIAAACTPNAQDLAGGADPDRGHFREAVRVYLAKLPADTELALGIVKMDAGKYLGIPGLASDHAKIEAARQALAEAEAEVAALEAENGNRLRRIHLLDREIADARNELPSWQRDWDGIEAQARATIAEKFADQSAGKIYSMQHVNFAFEDLQRVPILRELAPGAMAKLQGRIAAAEAELAELRAPEVEPSEEPPKLIRGRNIAKQAEAEEEAEPVFS